MGPVTRLISAEGRNPLSIQAARQQDSHRHTGWEEGHALSTLGYFITTYMHPQVHNSYYSPTSTAPQGVSPTPQRYLPHGAFTLTERHTGRHCTVHYCLERHLRHQYSILTRVLTRCWNDMRREQRGRQTTGYTRRHQALTHIRGMMSEQLSICHGCLVMKPSEHPCVAARTKGGEGQACSKRTLRTSSLFCDPLAFGFVLVRRTPPQLHVFSGGLLLGLYPPPRLSV